MNQVPHITKLLNELENIATADWKKWDIPNATANDFVKWAQSRAAHTYNEVKAEMALAEQSQEQYITADEARKLGAGAEYYAPIREGWVSCKHLEKFPFTFGDGEVIKYRAIKQPEPVEPTSAEYAQGYAEGFNDACKPKVEPHAELKALYAQQVKDGTLDNFVWEYQLPSSRFTECLSGDEPCSPEWLKSGVYKCTPKPTCQVRNLDTGDIKTMTREAAKLLQAETKDVCDWLMPNGFGYAEVQDFDTTGIYTYKLKANLVKLDGVLMTREDAIALWESKKDMHDIYHKSVNNRTWWHVGRAPAFDTHDNEGSFGEYQLRAKPLKQVSWNDMPVGVVIKLKTTGNSYIFLRARDGGDLDVYSPICANRARLAACFELAHASEQPWIAVQEDNAPLPEGFTYVNRWSGEDDPQLLAFKVTGLAEGYELK